MQYLASFTPPEYNPMDRLPPETLLHIINEMNRFRGGPRSVVDYRMFHVVPGPDGILRQYTSTHMSVQAGEETMQTLLSRGYAIIRAEWKPIHADRINSELWAHLVLHGE